MIICITMVHTGVGTFTFKSGFVDARGRGYKKKREGLDSAGLPMPIVENFCGGVRVTFQRM